MHVQQFFQETIRDELLAGLRKGCANILTINQTIPTNGCAGVTVSAETSDMTETMDEMISHLASAEGVLRFEIMAG